jgi:hypothetical protein
VVGFDPLPADLVSERYSVSLPEILQPLRVHELNHPLPRAFWVPGARVLSPEDLTARLDSPDFDPRREVLLAEPPARQPSSSAGAQATVAFERPNPHTVRLRFRGPEGYLVVLEGYHDAWRGVGPAGPVPILRADGRYWALPVAEAPKTTLYTARYEPTWRLPALALWVLGGAVCLGLIVPRRRRPLPSQGDR